jgi:hypothetical protein
MKETEMGYRGSKSKFVTQPDFVKEQRVDGSWFLNKLAVPKQIRNLRFTLMGFERNYQVKIPSKQLNRLFFSTVSCKTPKLNPFFVSGLIDAVSVLQYIKHKILKLDEEFYLILK